MGQNLAKSSTTSPLPTVQQLQQQQLSDSSSSQQFVTQQSSDQPLVVYRPYKTTQESNSSPSTFSMDPFSNSSSSVGSSGYYLQPSTGGGYYQDYAPQRQQPVGYVTTQSLPVAQPALTQMQQTQMPSYRQDYMPSSSQGNGNQPSRFMRLDNGFWGDDDPVFLPPPPRPVRPQSTPAPSGGGCIVDQQRSGLAADIIQAMRQGIQADRSSMDMYRYVQPTCQMQQPAQQQQQQPAAKIVYYDPATGAITGTANGTTQPTMQSQSTQQQQQQQQQSQAKIVYYDPTTGAITGTSGGSAQRIVQSQPQAAAPAQPAAKIVYYDPNTGAITGSSDGSTQQPQMTSSQAPQSYGQLVSTQGGYTTDGQNQFVIYPAPPVAMLGSRSTYPFKQ